jgi:hypothetical protein
VEHRRDTGSADAALERTNREAGTEVDTRSWEALTLEPVAVRVDEARKAE